MARARVLIDRLLSRDLAQRLVRSEVEAEQLDRLVRTTPWAWLLSTVGAVISYTQFDEGADAAALTIWFIAFCAVSTLRTIASFVWASRGGSTERAIAWAPGWLGSTYVHAAQWGLLSVVLATPGSAEAEAILHITLAAVAMGGAVRLPGFDRTMIMHVVLVLGPLVLRDLQIGGSYHLLIAFLVFLIGVYSLLSGRNQSRALREIATQRRRNADLIVALRHENERSEAARQAAEEASAARTRFFAAANHDLRQPLHAMGLLAQTLRTPGPRADLDQVCGHLVACVDGMTQVVDDLLDITHMDAGSMAPQWTVFAIDALVRECCRPYAAMARAKGLHLLVEAQAAVVRSDRALLARVLSNLVSNAIRYTCEGTVRIAVVPSAQHLQLSVEDTGIGISEEHLPRIFEEFYQVGNPARDRRLGLGLGLATVKRLSDLLALDVSVRSAMGRGSVFALNLPLASAGEAATLPAPGADRVEPLPNARRVLVIEDDADSRNALLGLLKSWGCDARAAPSQAAAVHLLRAGFEPDALVADLRLADGASGIDAVHAARTALGRALPAVIVTGDAGSEHMKAAQTVGLAVMIKPVKPVQLRAFLGQAFATS